MKEATISAPDTVADVDDGLQLVGFRIADELFGVDILMVQEIIKDVNITPIPDAPGFIKGVINLRGNIIPIIDLRRRLKLNIEKKEGNADSWIIILNVAGRVAGFIVDRVTRVFKMDVNEIEPPPDMLSTGLESDYINGVCKIEDKLLAILDFNRILVVEEFKKISAQKRRQTN